MDAAPRPKAWTSFAARVAGLWILAGCLLKAFLGTPADLPPVVRTVPLPLGTLFALVLGVEAAVGLAALLRPGRFWPAAVALLLGFGAVIATQLAAGAASCGCFGATITVPPWAMLAVDAAVLALLLAARPWRLARGGTADLVVAALALAVGVALPRLLDREAGPGDAPKTGLRAWAELPVTSWVGKRPEATELARFADVPAGRDGTWVLYRRSCALCAECLSHMKMFDQGARELTLVLVPEKPGSPEAAVVHTLPEGGFVRHVSLREGTDYVVTTPAILVVEGGVITSAREGIDPEACLPGR